MTNRSSATMSPVAMAVALAAWAFAFEAVCQATPARDGEDDALNIAPFGEAQRWDDAQGAYGVLWEDLREVYKVAVTFTSAPPAIDDLEVVYWQSSWPEHEIPRDKPSGSGSSGWFNVGDWFQGKWQVAHTQGEASNNTIIFTFHPLNAREFPGLAERNATYRTTFKLGVRMADPSTPLPEIASFEVYTDSILKPMDFEVEWKRPADAEGARIEVFNGTLHDSAQTDNGLRARIDYAETQRYNSFDETVVTVRCGANTFSFAPKDLLAWRHMCLPDLGALVKLAGEDIPYAGAEKACREAKDKDLYSRVFDVPEQTFPNAWGSMPEKGRHHIPLSFEGGRQHFGLDENGNVFLRWDWLGQITSTDSPRCLWDGNTIHYAFGLPSTPIVDRYRVDGYLPMMVTVWEDQGIRYTQSAFVTPLPGVPAEGKRILAETPLVMMVRIDMELAGSEAAEAHLLLQSRDDSGLETLITDGDCVASEAKAPWKLRMLVSNTEHLTQTNEGMAYAATLRPGAASQRLDIAIPYITFTRPGDSPATSDEEWQQLRALAFDDAFEAVRAHWQARVDQGAQITTPEPMINDFYKAHVAHLLINTEREVGGSDRYMVKVGTFSYGVFTNESCMMVSDLDRRGLHERAAQALETWLHYQGTVGLPGDFSTPEGQFFGAGGYEALGYNQHHGWTLWCLGEHYWYSHDVAWLAHAAPFIVKGCDWITKERNRTTQAAEASPIRAIERGLLPPGQLEDIRDWRTWLSTQAYTWWGMDNAARALVDAGYPDGQRILDDASAYKQDILAAFTEAMRRSPVVRLRNGSWIPHIPSDLHRRGRSFGWITETLEGAIHLVRCELLDPWDPRSTWIIKDFEDNLYISEQFGYNITGEELERHWFSRGGISQQANLLCNPIPYLQRDEAEHFLRAYFNAFAASYFPDTRMMTEHALPNIGDWRGDHYKSSDEANSTYWLRLMFLEERDNELWVGAAIPRYWLAGGESIGIERAQTYFGETSAHYTSHAGQGRIDMTLDPPRRNPPETIRVRFRHPESKRMTRCTVNGQPYTRFDPDHEWVELTECTGETKVTAIYE